MTVLSRGDVAVRQCWVEGAMASQHLIQDCPSGPHVSCATIDLETVV